MTTLKRCTKCNLTKDTALFYTQKDTKDGYRCHCKACMDLGHKNYYKSNKESIVKYKKVHWKKWYKENTEKKKETNSTWVKTKAGKSSRRAAKAKRRAAELSACPHWADVKSIKRFYMDCPIGYEVDHIFPLQGKNVSGLHVLENLQYLTKSENCSKGNRYEV